MKRFYGGNLQTAGKPSLFPLFCCGPRQNTSEPKYPVLMRKSFWFKDIFALRTCQRYAV